MDALKKALRRALRRKRAAVSPLIRTRAVLRHARAAIPANTTCVGLYSAFGTELDVRPLLDNLTRLGVSVALPVVDRPDSPLIFRQVDRSTQFNQSSLGIAEPAGKAPECWPDILFVPTLGMDRRGYRLGYGGGFYDRTLAAWAATGHKQPLTIGLAYEAQVVHRLPAARHDIPLNILITEAGCRRFR